MYRATDARRILWLLMAAGVLLTPLAATQPWSQLRVGVMDTEICTSEPLADSSATQFARENEAAMTRMMADMTLTPTGDIDRDFVSMMSPHHLGAIEMARSVLRHGRNETIRRMAQEIIVTQQQEIQAMQLAIGTRRTSGQSP